MRKFILLFLDLILGAQQKKFEQKLDKTLLSSTASSTKTHLTAYATMSLSTKTDERKKKLQTRVKEIIKKNIKTPEKLLEFIEKSGTKVYKIKYADRILRYIGENEGFITPLKGLKAFYLNLLVCKKFSFKTDAMFVLRNLPVNIYVMSHQFHKWYGYKLNLPGYDEDSQNKFKRIWEYENHENIKNLTYNETVLLKEAIKRDVESIDFVINLSKEHQGSKAGLEKIKEGKGAKV